jgi:hypothetical protein
VALLGLVLGIMLFLIGMLWNSHERNPRMRKIGYWIMGAGIVLWFVFSRPH